MLIEETRYLTVAQILHKQSRFAQTTQKARWSSPPLLRGLRHETAEAFMKTAQEELDFATAKDYRARDEQVEYLHIERPDMSDSSSELKMVIQSRKFASNMDPQVAVRAIVDVLNRAGTQPFHLYFDARDSAVSAPKNLQLIVLLQYRLVDARCLDHLTTFSVVGAGMILRVMLQTVSQFFRAKLRIRHVDHIPGEQRRVHIASVTNIHQDTDDLHD
jgi:hypothetical protein